MKLYTRTVCPKCLFVKSEITRLGLEVEMVNMDQNEAAKEEVKAQGIMAAPVLELNGEWYTEPGAIIAALEELAE